MCGIGVECVHGRRVYKIREFHCVYHTKAPVLRVLRSMSVREAVFFLFLFVYASKESASYIYIYFDENNRMENISLFRYAILRWYIRV